MKMRVAGAPAQTISAHDAAGIVKSGMWLDCGAVLAQPDVRQGGARALSERGAIRSSALRRRPINHPEAYVIMTFRPREYRAFAAAASASC
jgi:hypothetical protein